MPKSKINPDSPVIRELDAIKRLLALFLMKAGSSQEEISIALQVDQSVVSRMLPARKVKSFKFQK